MQSAPLSMAGIANVHSAGSRLERRYGPYDAVEARGHADRRRALNPPEPTGKQGSEREARAVAG